MAQDNTPDAGSPGGVGEGFSKLIAGLKQHVSDAVDNLHDRLMYGTQNYKNAVEDAASEPDATSKKDTNEGFQKAK